MLVTAKSDLVLFSSLRKMLILLIVLFFISKTTSININSTSYADVPKCCEVGSVFVKQNGNFLCNKSENAPVITTTNLFINLNTTEEYECLEAVDLNLFLFKRSLNKTVIVKNISDKILSKCCPSNYIYNSITRSCIKSLETNIFNKTFLKVGLVDCKIIYDYKFQPEDDIQVNSTDLYSNIQEKFSGERYCIDEGLNNTVVVRVCKKFDICENILCLHKCCPDRQSFINGSHCTNSYVYGMDLRHFSSLIADINADYAIVHGYQTAVYIPKVKSYHLDDRGNFYSFQEKIGKEIYAPNEETYCIEHATKRGVTLGYKLFRIFPQIEYMDKKFLFNRWAMIISNIFLTITVFYYIFSDETRKVFGKTLVSFCSTLFSLFVMLIYCTFNPVLKKIISMTTCKTIGFLIIYLSFSCFLWLQVMCYDIYSTFGSSKRYSSSNNKKKRDLKRFLYYSLYGWGVPLILTITLIIFHTSDILPPSITIKMGETKCLIETGNENYAEILFYIIPLTLTQSVNIIFFIKTVRYCLQVKINIQKMNQSVDAQKKNNKFRARKERFGLVIKLSFIMGFFYLFEVVSSFYDFKKNVITEYIEIIWDFINCLQGVFIFFIFICKKKYFKSCSRKVAIEKIRKISLTTNSTKVISLSSDRKSSRGNHRKYSKEEAKNKFG